MGSRRLDGSSFAPELESGELALVEFGRWVVRWRDDEGKDCRHWVRHCGFL